MLASTVAPHLPKTRAVAVTNGAKGCSYATPKHNGHTSAFELESEDTIRGWRRLSRRGGASTASAGDGVLEESKLLHYLLRYPSAIGALNTLRTGAMGAQPTHQKIEAFLTCTQRLNLGSLNLWYGNGMMI